MHKCSQLYLFCFVKQIKRKKKIANVGWNAMFTSSDLKLLIMRKRVQVYQPRKNVTKPADPMVHNLNCLLPCVHSLRLPAHGFSQRHVQQQLEMPPPDRILLLQTRSGRAQLWQVPRGLLGLWRKRLSALWLCHRLWPTHWDLFQ